LFFLARRRYYKTNSNFIHIRQSEEKFVDTKGVIRSSNSKTDIQHAGQK